MPTFVAPEHHHPATNIRLCCMVTEARIMLNVVGEKASDLFDSSVIFFRCRILLINFDSFFGDHCTSLIILCWELWRIESKSVHCYCFKIRYCQLL